ncbi:prophage integrase [Obesumbacterium proteus ATCC 12841]|uniref:Prophage integrase n=1 Tax=Obesumbacterium proteus ATCC 12841 TaxID=1354268 RepID=A0AA91EKZ0_9GAMM|nr:prophage integrase [Obesumbacterium proteus ATCC 12841]
MWRTEKQGEAPVKLFEEACLRWMNEKSHKRYNKLNLLVGRGGFEPPTN